MVIVAWAQMEAEENVIGNSGSHIFMYFGFIIEWEEMMLRKMVDTPNAWKQDPLNSKSEIWVLG